MRVTDIIDPEQILSPEMSLLFNNAFVEEQHKKGTLLLEVGRICQKVYIVKEGLLRSFYYKNGKDVTHWFAAELEPLSALDSFFKRRPCDYSIDVLEDSVVYTITLDRLNALFDAHHEIERFARLFITEMMIQVSDKVKDLQFRTGLERYHLLLQKHPAIIQRAPLGKVASYLGITQQSLSRIRAQR
jgi:CRP-like cAMP-binding protein